MTDAGLSQVLSDPRRRLTLKQCLRLAARTHSLPVAILKLAGRPDEAELVESLWPRTREHLAISQSEKELLTLWREMRIPDRHHVRALVTICVERARANTVGPLGTPRAALPRGRPVKALRVSR